MGQELDLRLEKGVAPKPVLQLEPEFTLAVYLRDRRANRGLRDIAKELPVSPYGKSSVADIVDHLSQLETRGLFYSKALEQDPTAVRFLRAYLIELEADGLESLAMVNHLAGKEGSTLRLGNDHPDLAYFEMFVALPLKKQNEVFAYAEGLLKRRGLFRNRKRGWDNLTRFLDAEIKEEVFEYVESLN
jgi:hypothetical protein